MNIKELEQEISGKRAALLSIFEKGVEHLTADEVEDVKRRNAELNDLGAKLAQLREVAEIAETARKSQRLGPGAAPAPQAQSVERKSTRDYIVGRADALAALKAGTVRDVVIDMPDVDIKTLITLTTINNQATRRAGVVDMALEQRTVGDLLLPGTLDNNSLEYFEETTWTNAAATVAEGGTKPESAWGVTLRTETMRKIAHNIPLTDEVLTDVSGLDSMVRGRLVFGVERAEEAQVLSGSGVAPNLTGILNRAGIQTQARGTDPGFDALYKAMTKIRNIAFAEPTAIVMNPTDWQNLVLTRTADGIYILGNPAGEAPQRIWGLDVRATTAMTLGTALVGAFRPYGQLFRRGGITVTVSTEHSSFFAENKVLVQAEERILLAIYRPSAFATVTGL